MLGIEGSVIRVGGVYSIPANGSSMLRKLLYDAGTHFAVLEVIFAASLSPQGMTDVLPKFQNQVQLLRIALEPHGIEDSLEWFELSVDDPLLRCETLSCLRALSESLCIRFHGDHLFFAWGCTPDTIFPLGVYSFVSDRSAGPSRWRHATSASLGVHYDSTHSRPRLRKSCTGL
jgi:hypothetical protein